MQQSKGQGPSSFRAIWQWFIAFFRAIWQGFTARLFGPTAWRAWGVLTDQAVVSFGNFVIGVVLLRGLITTEYGQYLLLLETALFLNCLQSAFINYPLTVRCAGADRDKIVRESGAAIVLTLCLAPIMVGLLICLAGTAKVVACVAGAMICWQLQETFRRTLIADMRVFTAVWGDAVSYLGQCVVVYFLHQHHMLTLQSTFLAVGATSLAGALLQAFQIGVRRISFKEVSALAVSYFRVGRWTLFASLEQLVTTLLLLYTLKYYYGPVALAEFGALSLILKPTNPISIGLGGLVTPAVAQKQHTVGSVAGMKIGLIYTLLGTGLLLPYYAIVLFFPGQCIQFIHKANSPYVAYKDTVWLFVIYFFMSYLTTMTAACLTGLRSGRAYFVAQIVQVLMTLATAYPMARYWGVKGMLIGSSISMLALNLTMFAFIARQCGVRFPRSTPRPPREPLSVPSPTMSLAD